MTVIVTSQDQEVADIISNALFGWAYDRVSPDSQAAVQAVLQALHDHQYVITKIDLPPPVPGVER